MPPISVSNTNLANLQLPDLPAALRALLRQVPAGRVTTYGDLAEALGDLAAARWVGEWMLDHPHDAACPCHRVVRRTGEAGLFITRNEQEKIARLAAEGVPASNRCIDLRRFGFAEFETDFPLRRLKAIQAGIPERLLFEPLRRTPDVVGGVDVSYADGDAVAACLLFDVRPVQQPAVDRARGPAGLVEVATVRQPARFPYIPGYLSFRELPALMAAVRKLSRSRDLPEVCFVDGNGLLHPRGAGIASHFGVATGLRTIGIGKKLLCGSVDVGGLQPGESRPVMFEDRIIGAAVRAETRSRPIYVSPGHRIDVQSAVRLTQELFRGHRLPEPLFLADRLSRETAKQ